MIRKGKGWSVTRLQPGWDGKKFTLTELLLKAGHYTKHCIIHCMRLSHWFYVITASVLQMGKPRHGLKTACLRSDRLEVVPLEFVSTCGSSPGSFFIFFLSPQSEMTLTAYGRAHGKYNRTDRLWSRSAKGLGTKEDTGLKKIYRWRNASPTCPISFSDMMTSSTGCCYHGYRRWSSFFQGEQTMGRCAHEFSFTSCKIRIGTDFIVFL